MEIYYEEDKYRAPDHLRSTLKNLPMKYTARGVNVRRIDHLALLARSVPENRKFAQQTLGFALREQVMFENGTLELGSWLSPSPVHHQVAYVMDTKGASGRLHHISLWVDNREDVLRAADILAENGILHRGGTLEAQRFAGVLPLLLRAGRKPGRSLLRKLSRLRPRLGGGYLERGGTRHRRLLGHAAARELHQLRHAGRGGRQGPGAQSSGVRPYLTFFARPSPASFQNRSMAM